MKSIPEGRTLSDQAKRSLASDARYVRSYQAFDQNVYIATFIILAHTPERAKELTQALLTFFDHGIVAPIQEQLKKAQEGLEEELAQSSAGLAGAQKVRDAATQQMKDVEVLEDQAINDLKTQRRLLEVDLAGVKARIDACEAILNRDLSKTRRDQVENVKITAEIELAGLAARQKTLDTIIDQGQKAATLGFQLRKAQNEVSQWQGRIAQTEQRIADYVRKIELHGPFRLVDEKVVIHPIKWEAKPAEK